MDKSEGETVPTEVGTGEDIASQGALGAVLSFAEARVLGCLLEKEVVTPAAYPMTLSGLQTASNQRSSREPLSDFDEDMVSRALEGLREKRLVVKVHLSGSRAPKYKQTLENVIHLEDAPRALICVLLLRGVQTAGELNQRTDRLFSFQSVDHVETVIQELMNHPGGPLVREIPPGNGRRVKSYAQLLSKVDLSPEGGEGRTAEEIVLQEEASWRKSLEERVMGLEDEVRSLREELTGLRRELEG
ncbi:MAG: DUF480 domain-containing protein [Verrucomicrobiota bacterium]